MHNATILTLNDVKDHFDHCRATRTKRGKIPACLWDENSNPILIDWESSRLVNTSYEIVNAALDWSGITTGFINEDIFTTMIKTYLTYGEESIRTFL